jgi:hypothetical protein
MTSSFAGNQNLYVSLDYLFPDDEDQFRVVKLRRSDLTLRVDDYGQDVRLIFTKKLE